MHNPKIKHVLMALTIGLTSFQNIHPAPHKKSQNIARQAHIVASTQAAHKEKRIEESPKPASSSSITPTYGRQVLTALTAIVVFAAQIQAGGAELPCHLRGVALGDRSSGVYGACGDSQTYYRSLSAQLNPPTERQLFYQTQLNRIETGGNSWHAQQPRPEPFKPIISPIISHQPKPIPQPQPPVEEKKNLPEHAYTASGHLPHVGGTLAGIDLDELYKTGQLKTCPGEGCPGPCAGGDCRQ
ncbi:hypothetical protein KJZ61_01630 [Candidatus Dependentiae bacterium]|nr:hypothetical protein [Candidatus Dependentiae bacterium]